MTRPPRSRNEPGVYKVRMRRSRSVSSSKSQALDYILRDHPVHPRYSPTITELSELVQASGLPPALSVPGPSFYTVLTGPDPDPQDLAPITAYLTLPYLHYISPEPPQCVSADPRATNPTSYSNAASALARVTQKCTNTHPRRRHLSIAQPVTGQAAAGTGIRTGIRMGIGAGAGVAAEEWLLRVRNEDGWCTINRGGELMWSMRLSI